MIKKNKEHTARLDNLRSVARLKSFYVQQSINNIVSGEEPLLKTMTQQPFVENACCNTTFKTLEYFSSKDSSILKENKKIIEYEATYNRLSGLAKAPILFNGTNTKKRFINVFPEFSEETVYRAFIHFCKYNSYGILPEYLKGLCSVAPEDFNSRDSIANKIVKLKEKGINYTQESLFKLIQRLASRNEFNANFSLRNEDVKVALENVLNALISRDVFAIDEKHPNIYYLKLFENIKKRLSGQLGEQKLKENIIKQNESFKQFLTRGQMTKQNLTKKKIATIENVIQVLEQMLSRENSEKITSTANIVEKVKNIILKLTGVYPNIIANSFDTTTINVPDHWKISVRHIHEVKNIVEKQNNLKTLFESGITSLFNDADVIVSEIVLFIEALPLHTPEIITTHEVFEVLKYIVYNEMYKITQLDMIKQRLDADPAGASDMDGTDVNDFVIKTATKQKPEEKSEVDEVALLSKTAKKSKLYECLAKIAETIKEELKYFLDDYDKVKMLVKKSKIAEKESIVTYLNEMTVEEREIENLFKNNKLGDWNIGLQKGLREYDPKMYDKEMDLIDRKQITADTIDDELERRGAHESEADAYDLNIADDDDGGEDDYVLSPYD